MKTLKRHLLLGLAMIFCCNNICAQQKNDEYWSDTSLWYQGDTRLSIAHIDTAQPDVFYLLPTCVFAWTDSTGTARYNADPRREDHREAWRLSAELADTIFATKANLFLPYYRQGTFGTPDAKTYNAAADMARTDALAAFDYYLKHINQGRPFILAGFSQGAKMVVQALKHMDDEAYQRLIAAYVIGYGITADDTIRGKNHLQHILLAQDSTARGVTVCFNSVTTPAAIAKGLCDGNIACINPVSWTTTSAPATLLKAGAVPAKDDARFPYGTAAAPATEGGEVTVSIDQQHKVLIVKGLDTKRYFLPALSTMFPEGNLHLQELFFYGDILRRNVLLRSGAEQ